MRRAKQRSAPRSRLLAPLVRLAALRASGLRRRVRAALADGRRRLRRLLRGAGRQPGHLARVLRRLRTRLRARKQARRQDKTETNIQ